MSEQSSAATTATTPRSELSRPIRSLSWLSLFTELAIAVTLPFALILSAVELIHIGPESTSVRVWTAFIIAILPFHIVCVDRLLRQPRRHAPPATRASQVFAGLFVAAMLIFTIVIVVWPALEIFDRLALHGRVSANEVVGYLAIMVFYQIVLWAAWLATPQLDEPAGSKNLIWTLPGRRGKRNA